MNKIQKCILIGTMHEGHRWESFKQTAGKAAKTAGTAGAGAGIYWAAKNPKKFGKAISKVTGDTAKHAKDWGDKVKDGIG